MQNSIARLHKMYVQIENLFLATNDFRNLNTGYIMKYMLLSLTSTDEIRRILNECVDNSSYTHKELACKLSRLFPGEGWSERCINYLLTDSTDISMTKANQIMEFLYPDQKFDFSMDNFHELIDSMQERLSNLRSEFSRATKYDRRIDDRDLDLIMASTKMLHHLICNFNQAATKAVNVTLS